MDTSKLTLISDVSFWEAPIDFVKMKSAGVKGTIIRAGQNLWVDSSFKDYWADAKKAGLPRGSYWFYDSRIEPKTQAELWVKTVGEDFGELPFVFDIEESYNGAFRGSSNWIVFLEHLKTLVNGHEIKIYTGYYFFKDNCIESDKIYFKQYGNPWLANYSSEPLVPYPFDDWEIWQFSEDGDGKKFGCGGGNVDLNYFKGTEAEFIKRFNIPDMTLPPVIPNDPKPIATHDGVIVHHINRFGANCYVHVIDPKKARVFVTPRYNFGTVKHAIQKYGGNISINGGGWPQPSIPGVFANEVWYSDGVPVNTKAKDFRGYINVSKTGELAIHETSTLGSNLWNCWGFDRILVVNGKFNEKISDKYTKDARTGTGVTLDGKLILLSAEGNDYHQEGLSFPEMASTLIEFGAIIAGNCDGGSSTQCINTALSENSLFVGSDVSDANVINHVIIYATPTGNTIPPVEPDPTGEKMNYTVLAKCKPRKTPTMYETVTLPELLVGKTFIGSTLHKVVSPGKVDDGVTFVQDESTLYWLPLFYNGIQYVKEVSVVPPVVDAEMNINMTVPTGVNVTVTVNGVTKTF